MARPPRQNMYDALLWTVLSLPSFHLATHVHNRTPKQALGGRTPYEVFYGGRPDASRLRTFGVLCIIVEPKERLKQLDDRVTMCPFVGYKYEGGGYRIWDPKRQVVVESTDVVFFDVLPSPTLNDLPPRPVDEGESVTQPVLDHSIGLIMLPVRSCSPHCPRQRPLPYQRLCPSLYPHQYPIHASPYTCLGVRCTDKPRLPRTPRTSPRTPTRTRTRTRVMDPTRMPTHLRVSSTIFHTFLFTLRSRCAQASFAMEDGVEIAPCTSWMKQHILLSLFRPVYQVEFRFRSCPTCVA